LSGRASLYLLWLLEAEPRFIFRRRREPDAEQGLMHVKLNSKRVKLNSKRVKLNSKRVKLNSKRVKLNSKRVKLNSKRVKLNSKRVKLNIVFMEFVMFASLFRKINGESLFHQLRTCLRRAASELKAL
jgi:hypothetical protein